MYTQEKKDISQLARSKADDTCRYALNDEKILMIALPARHLDPPTEPSRTVAPLYRSLPARPPRTITREMRMSNGRNPSAATANGGRAFSISSGAIIARPVPATC